MALNGFTPRERNGLIALGIVVILALALGFFSGSGSCAIPDKTREHLSSESLIKRAVDSHGDETDLGPVGERVKRDGNSRKDSTGGDLNSRSKKNKKGKKKKSSNKKSRKGVDDESKENQKPRSLLDERY